MFDFKDLVMWVNLINDSVKSDLPDKKINEEEAKHYSGEYGMKFISVSAKERVNILIIYLMLGRYTSLVYSNYINLINLHKSGNDRLLDYDKYKNCLSLIDVVNHFCNKNFNNIF